MNSRVFLALAIGISFSQASLAYSGLVLNPPQAQSSSSSSGRAWNPGSSTYPFTFNQAYDYPTAQNSKRSHRKEKTYLCGEHCEPGEGEAIDAQDVYTKRRYAQALAHGNQVCHQFIVMIERDALAEASISIETPSSSIRCSEDGHINWMFKSNLGFCTLRSNTASRDHGAATASVNCGEWGAPDSWEKSYGNFGYNNLSEDIQRKSLEIFNKTQKRYSR